ncbi:DUF4190 domain-containing protein [Mycobacterium simiae]|uniref:DUF4190 domain-containing protein n=1 Tax=Mycobacterium simiae TaxID=1784 RepID=UPI00138D667D|nr:DUF4190 domain-containing protein [Mycobacterium simiae]BBX40392.1 hypothetical protein MSIM_18430 [Mycobacterium simiae]
MTEEPPSYPPPHDSGYPPPNQGYSPGQGYPPPPGPSYPPPPGYPPPQGSIYPPAAGTNGMAIASLVCSLLGWICGVGPILGIIFGVLALGKIKETGQGGRGLAIAGIAIGSVLIVLLTIGGILRALGEFEHQDLGAPAPTVLTVDAVPTASLAPALAA